MTTRPQPPCPECEKLAAVSEESNKIGNFLDWMRDEDLEIAEYDENGILYRATRYDGGLGINRLLAEYFKIDLDEVERERRALLDWLREQHGDE